MTQSYTATTTAATSVAARKLEIKNGSVCPIPPAVVINPVTLPRSQGEPRRVSEPSSDSPSENGMEIPAPKEAAIPTSSECHLCFVANAAANNDASVDTEPSI